jgi:hypothetical protein
MNSKSGFTSLKSNNLLRIDEILKDMYYDADLIKNACV